MRIRTLSTATVNEAGATVVSVYNKFQLMPPPLSPIVEGDRPDFTHNQPLNIHYFHPDHLGSSSYITNQDGKASQHMEYLPFGETLVDEHTNSISTPFKFNGKEYDEETGNYYYGARYYDPKWSIFISVDPLAEKYPGWSSYNYTLNNPIKYVDPTGKGPEDIIIWGWNPILKQYKEVVVIKSNEYNINYYSKEIMAPLAPVSLAPVSLAPGEPVTMYGFDLIAKAAGNPDAIRFNISAELHAGTLNIGGTIGVVAPLRGEDKGGLFFYRPSNEKGFDIGFERDSRSFSVSALLGFSLIYDSDRKYEDFNRFTFEGIEQNAGLSLGIFNVSGFKSQDGSYGGVSASVGKSIESDKGRKSGSISLSGAKLIPELTIEPDPTKRY